MKPPCPQMPAAFSSIPMLFASPLPLLACLFLPVAAAAQGVSTTTTIPYAGPSIHSQSTSPRFHFGYSFHFGHNFKACAPAQGFEGARLR
ncbi:MAG: hypothetical protein WA476_18095, partial [Acidobacteriaceae bacterium]